MGPTRPGGLSRAGRNLVSGKDLILKRIRNWRLCWEISVIEENARMSVAMKRQKENFSL